MTTTTSIPTLCTRCHARVALDYDAEFGIFVGNCISCGCEYYPDAEVRMAVPVNPVEENRKKTHCKKGHPYNEENTGFRINRKTGARQRYCKTCNRVKHRRIYWASRPGV